MGFINRWDKGETKRFYSDACRRLWWKDNDIKYVRKAYYAITTKNEKYTGNALLQKKYVKDHLTKTLVLNKGNIPKYYAEGTHTAIIDIATIKKAQQIMSENRGRYFGKKESVHYIFTGKIV